MGVILHKKYGIFMFTLWALLFMNLEAPASGLQCFQGTGAEPGEIKACDDATVKFCKVSKTETNEITLGCAEPVVTAPDCKSANLCVCGADGCNKNMQMCQEPCQAGDGKGRAATQNPKGGASSNVPIAVVTWMAVLSVVGIISAQ